MSFPFHQQYMDYSTPTTPGAFPWDVDDPTAHGSASISPEALQQPVQLHQDHQQVQPTAVLEPLDQLQAQHEPQTPASSTYQPLPTIELQERIPPSQFRFDNMNESHFQQMPENPPTRSSTRSSSRRPSALRVEVGQSGPSTASSLGPTRSSQRHHPYRRTSDGSGPSGSRAQTGSRRARDDEGGSGPRHEIHERQSRLGVSSDSSLVGRMLPMVGTGAGTPTASCPAVHTWRVNPNVVSIQTTQPAASSGSVPAAGVTASPEATSPRQAPTPGSVHLPLVPMNTPQMPAPEDFSIPSVPPAASRTGSMPPPPVQPSLQHTKHYHIRTDVHYDETANQMTAMFELPGCKKSDLKINMSVCPYSGVRQVTVRGRSYPRLPEFGYTIMERKFGSFSRSLVVPMETKPGDVDVLMEDGILILRIPGGTPSAPEPLQDIPIL